MPRAIERGGTSMERARREFALMPLGVKQTYSIPSIEALDRQSEAWGPSYPSAYDMQSTAPRDRHMLRKLGILGKARILSIASYRGDWASALARAGATVDFTDLADAFVALSRAGGEFRNSFAANYVHLPPIDSEYDWTFSYEPVGGTSGGLAISMLRSLRNRAGAILIFRKSENPGKAVQFPRIVRTLSHLYGATCAIETVSVTAKVRGEGDRPRPVRFCVCKLQTNPRARGLAKSDIACLEQRDGLRVTAATLHRLYSVGELLKPHFLAHVAPPSNRKNVQPCAN